MSHRAFVILLAAVVLGRGAAADAPLRVLSYNIHHGRGTDGVVDLERIAGVIRGSAADVVVLQEVDDRTERTGRIDQTAELGRLTGLHAEFGRQIDYQGGRYGQAILSRTPLEEPRVHVLPGDPDRETLAALLASWRSTTAEPQPTFPAGQPARQIDFILYRAGGVLEPGRVRVLDEPVASDHRPILAEFRVR